MGDEFYSIIKLMTGEEVFALVSVDDINNVYKSSGKVKITDEMGYISNVEDARKKFEILYKINQEPKEN